MKLISKLSIATGIIALVLVPIAHAVSISQLYITPANMLGWYDASVNGGSTAYVDGAPTAAFGVSSLQLQTPLYGFDAAAGYGEWPNNVTLAQVTQLGYWAKQVTALDLTETANIVMDADLNGDGITDTTLTYKPKLQNTGVSVQTGVWQYWDATDGMFTSSANYGNLSAGGATYPLSQIKQWYPLAKLNTFAVGIGPQARNSTVDIDGITLGVNVYDFELTEPVVGTVDVPKTIMDCKKYGWETLFTAEGNSFKNQGECVSYIVSSKAKVK